MKKTIPILTLVLCLFSCSTTSVEKDLIVKTMRQQEKDWNNGDIENFMEGYWKSDSLMFVSKRGIKYGWETTLENYKKSYPNKAAMGKLQFEILTLEVNKKTAYTLGKWELERKVDTLSGYYTLFWKKIEGKWLITIDHTS